MGKWHPTPISGLVVFVPRNRWNNLDGHIIHKCPCTHPVLTCLGSGGIWLPVTVSFLPLNLKLQQIIKKIREGMM